MTAKTSLAFMIAIACMAVTGWTQGQPAPQPQAGAEGGHAQLTELSQQIGTIQARMQEIQGQLEEIAKKAVENNPQIQAQHTALMQLYQSKLQQHGYPSDEELQKIQQLQAQLQAPGTSDDAERQQMVERFQANVAVLQQAQQRAQQDPEVQKAFEEFEAARLKAMNEVNPEAGQLQAEMETLNQQVQTLQAQIQQLMQNQR